MLKVILVIVVIVVVELKGAPASKVKHSANTSGDGNEQADANQNGCHGAFSFVFDEIVLNDLRWHLTERPEDFTLGGRRVLGHGIAGIVARVKAGERDDVPLALLAGEHALGRSVANQRESEVNGSVGFCSERGVASIGFVVHHFNRRWRARNDLPGEPDHHVEGIGVGDRAGDAHVRSVAVPRVGGRSAIHGGREGDIGERRLNGLVGLVGGVGLVSFRIGCRSKDKRGGKFREVERRGRGSKADHQPAVVGADALNGQLVSTNLSRAVVDRRTGCIRGVPVHGHVGEEHALCDVL